ncbi:hypothetical protein IFR05_014939, partial [Cadophora sp. M221]
YHRNGQWFIEIQRNGSTERLIIDGLMRARCISSRATTCWKAHREGDPQTPLVIKGSWQYTDREEEGELLREATEKGVVNVARYYHHEIARVLGTDDDTFNDILKHKYSWYTKSRSNSTTGLKRSSSQAGAPLPPSKRSSSASITKANSNALPDQVHRRVIFVILGSPSTRVAPEQFSIRLF